MLTITRTMTSLFLFYWGPWNLTHSFHPPMCCHYALRLQNPYWWADLLYPCSALNWPPLCLSFCKLLGNNLYYIITPKKKDKPMITLSLLSGEIFQGRGTEAEPSRFPELKGHRSGNPRRQRWLRFTGQRTRGDGFMGRVLQGFAESPRLVSWELILHACEEITQSLEGEKHSEGLKVTIPRIHIQQKLWVILIATEENLIHRVSGGVLRRVFPQEMGGG